MNLKRMAVVAAAAVVGPTVLMATPAMADEAKNTAVTTPDSAPKGDSAATETPAAPAADTAKPAVETPAPAKDAKPAAEKPAPAPAKPAPAPADEDAFQATGPVLGLNGVPASFKAGGDWTNITVKVDNSKGKAQESYVLVLAVADEASKLSAQDVHVQLFYQGGWHDVQIMSDEGTPVALLTDDVEIPAKQLSLQVRVKFHANAPQGNIAIAVAGGSNVDEHVYSDTAWAESKIVSGAGQGGGNHSGGNTGGHTGGDTGGHTGDTGGGHTGGGNDTKPNGGGTTTPIVDHNTGSNTGTGTTAGGQLAETGADAATSWALGAGGVALAMGAALVAGTGRRRRVTN
ncbi:hypothetical protein PL81_14395 [Streptomyces sp. RSD-27]|nr:hypothetical protein PL81_14395 [Streptomyces sp. RSD-27]